MTSSKYSTSSLIKMHRYTNERKNHCKFFANESSGNGSLSILFSLAYTEEHLLFCLGTSSSSSSSSSYSSLGNAIKSADQPPPKVCIGFRVPRRIAAHLRVQCREGFIPLIASGPTYRISTVMTPPRMESDVARVCDDLIDRPPSLL